MRSLVKLLQFFYYNTGALSAEAWNSFKPEMHLFEILVLVSGFCLVFTKAESKTDGTLDDFFDDQSDVPDEESLVEDKPGKTAENDHLSPLKEDPKAKEEPKEDAHKRFIPSRQIFLTISVPTNINSAFFQTCYCFRRRCFVPGMSPGFKGWVTVFQSGYVVINNNLYFFWNCSPRPQPIPLRPRPTPTRLPFSRSFPTRRG